MKDEHAKVQDRLRKAANKLKKEKKKKALLRQERARAEEEKVCPTTDVTRSYDLNESQLLLEEHYASTKEELQGKSKKLLALQQRYRALQQEVQEQQDEFEEERQGYQATHRKTIVHTRTGTWRASETCTANCHSTNGSWLSS